MQETQQELEQIEGADVLDAEIISETVSETESVDTLEMEQAQESAPAQDEPEIYQEKNPALDALVSEATTTKTDEQAQARDKKRETSFEISNEQAIDYAITGIQSLTLKASVKFNKDCRVPDEAIGLAAMLFAPLIQKYGKHVKRYLHDATDAIDLNSNVPEYMALGGASALAGWVWWQKTNGNDIEVNPRAETSNDGD